MACFTPPCSRISSATSASPDVPSYLVKGARSGLVTGSLAMVRAVRKVATVSRTASPSGMRSGRRRPDTRTAAAPAATTAEYSPIAPSSPPSGRGSPCAYCRCWLRAQRRSSSVIAMRSPLPGGPAGHAVRSLPHESGGGGGGGLLTDPGTSNRGAVHSAQNDAEFPDDERGLTGTHET